MLTLTFKVTQILSGHWCFRNYEHHREPEETSKCQEHGAAVDSLEECPRFDQQRHAIRKVIWIVLLPAVVTATLVGRDEHRKVIPAFRKVVMVIKENEERDREMTQLKRKDRQQLSSRTKDCPWANTICE